MGRRLQADLRSIKALELAEQGANYDEIAEHLGYADRSGAWRAVMRGLRWRGELAVNFYRLQRVVDLDATQAAAWPAAQRGNIRATRKVLACIEGRMRLLEDAPRDSSRATRQATDARTGMMGSVDPKATGPSWSARDRPSDVRESRVRDRTSEESAVAPIVVMRDDSWFDLGW